MVLRYKLLHRGYYIINRNFHYHYAFFTNAHPSGRKKYSTIGIYFIYHDYKIKTQQNIPSGIKIRENYGFKI